MKEENLETIKQILNYSFQIILFLFLITLLLQQFYPFGVNSTINLNWFMLAVILIGALSIIFPPKELKHENKHRTWKDYLFIVSLGIAGFIIIKLKIAQLGWLSWLISIVAGILIILLSLLVLEEDEERDKNEEDE